jgi:hypothetical protein
MPYKRILNGVTLAATPKEDVEVFTIAPGYPKLGLCLKFVAAPSSSGAIPSFRLYWVIPGVGESLATVRYGITTSGGEATMNEFDGIIACKDLTDSDGSVIRYREYDLAMGATGVRIEPFQDGDATHFGALTVWMGRSSS